MLTFKSRLIHVAMPYVMLSFEENKTYHFSGVTDKAKSPMSGSSTPGSSQHNTPEHNSTGKKYSTVNQKQDENREAEQCENKTKKNVTSTTMDFLSSLSWQNTKEEKSEGDKNSSLFSKEEGEGLLSESDDDEFAALSEQRSKVLNDPNFEKDVVSGECLLNFDEEKADSQSAKEMTHSDLGKPDIDNRVNQQQTFDPFAELSALSSEGNAQSNNEPKPTTDSGFLFDAFTDQSSENITTNESKTNIDNMFDSFSLQTGPSDAASTKKDDMFDFLNDNSSNDVNLLGSWNIHNVKDSISTMNIPRNDSGSNMHQSSSASNFQQSQGMSGFNIPRNNSGTNIPRNSSGTFPMSQQQSMYGQSRSGNNSPITTRQKVETTNSVFDPFAEFGTFAIDLHDLFCEMSLSRKINFHEYIQCFVHILNFFCLQFFRQYK